MWKFAALVSTVLAVSASCGDDGVNKLADAPPPPEDAAPIDAPASGTANITTNVRCCDVAPGTPQAGVTIAVVHADHSLGAMATSDAQGKASVTVRPGDSVFAVYPENQNNHTHISTFVGVKPGDNLTFGEGFYTLPITPGVNGQLNVSWPAVANAANYVVYAPCGGNAFGTATSGVYTLASYCQTPTAPMLFVALDAQSQVIASAFLPAAPFTPGTLPAITWTTTTAPNYLVSATGLGAAIRYVNFSALSMYAGLDYSMGLTPQIVNGAAMSGLSTTTGAARTIAVMELGRFGSNGYQYYEKAQASPVAFTETLPWVTGLAIDASQGQAVWLQTQGTYDGAALFFNWGRSDGKVFHSFDWTVIVPPGLTALDMGVPPPDLADYLPKAADFVGAFIRLVDLANVTGYDQLRGQPEATVTNPQAAVDFGVVPGANVSSFSSQNDLARRR